MEDVTNDLTRYRIGIIPVAVLGFIFVGGFIFTTLSAGKHPDVQAAIISARPSVIAQKIENERLATLAADAAKLKEKESVAGVSTDTEKDKPVKPVEQQKPKSYTFAAIKGEGVSKLARRSLLSYSNDQNVKLSRAKMLYAEVLLTNKNNPKPLSISETRTFSSDDIKSALDSFDSLTPRQQKLWSNLSTNYSARV